MEAQGAEFPKCTMSSVKHTLENGGSTIVSGFSSDEDAGFWASSQYPGVSAMDVKQHLKRKHTPDDYCRRCLSIFRDEEGLTQHVSFLSRTGSAANPHLGGKP
ncbi:hypothetical protein LX36DRAFT_716600 [Colletotrichum falcatum]|nr:hypothetical protein LX36DRAFT_716600 [Colletotrichum falcatum]